jgi:hypothetical protein
MRQPARGDGELPHPGRSTHLAIEVLSAYLDNALPAADRAHADAHLATCAVCRQELRELTATVALLRALPEPRPRRSFQLSPSQIQAQAPWWQRLGERMLPRLPAIRAATVAVALLLVAVTTIDLVRDTETGSLSRPVNQPAGLATSIAPHGALTETGDLGQAKLLPTPTASDALAASQRGAPPITAAAGRTSQAPGPQEAQSASNTLAAEPMPTLPGEAAGRVAGGGEPGSSVDTTAIAGSLDDADSSRAAEAPVILAGESEQAAPAMEAAASTATAHDAEMSIAEEGVSQSDLATAAEAPVSAFVAPASPTAHQQQSSRPVSTPEASPSPTRVDSATPAGEAIQGAPERGAWSAWRIMQVVLAAMLVLLLLTLVALQRLRSRRTV